MAYRYRLAVSDAGGAYMARVDPERERLERAAAEAQARMAAGYALRSDEVGALEEARALADRVYRNEETRQMRVEGGEEQARGRKVVDLAARLTRGLEASYGLQQLFSPPLQPRSVGITNGTQTSPGQMVPYSGKPSSFALEGMAARSPFARPFAEADYPVDAEEETVQAPAAPAPRSAPTRPIMRQFAMEE